MDVKLINQAKEQLSWIERYFDKNWMDSDFPCDAVWSVLFEYQKIIESTMKESS
jgi:tRNA A37 N6-isopentenylltransferase MiaA